MVAIKPVYKYFAAAVGALLILLVVIAYLTRREEIRLREIHVHVDSLENIIPISDTLVPPYVYDHVIMLGTLPLEQRKKKFVDVMLPAILIVRYRLLESEEKVKSIIEKIKEGEEVHPEDSLYISSLMQQYHVKDTADLIPALHPHPVSIALAQAALESGWGSSRFFKEANNVFGIWSYDPEEPRVRAAYRRAEKAVYLKKYDNLMSSVKDYFKIIGRGRVYRQFRKKRMETTNVFELIWYLRSYSEKRSQYVVLLRDVIVANDFLKYDHYQLHPDYFE